MSRPNLSYLKNLIVAVFGVPCGVLMGVTGLSAAPILLPSLRYLLGTKGSTLNGVVLTMVSFCAWCSLITFSQAGHVQWLNGIGISIGSLAGAALATRSVMAFPLVLVKARPFWTFLPLFFGLTMIAQSTGMLPHTVAAHGPLLAIASELPFLASLLIGIVVGFIGLAGELGGMLTVPLIVFVLGRSILAAEGTALFVLVLASLPTAVVHALRKTLDINVAVALTAGGVLGALFGSHLATDAVTGLTSGSVVFLSGLTLASFSMLSLFQKPVAEEPPSSDSTTTPL